MGKYLFWGDVSNRFLDNRLGVLANINYEKAKNGDDWYKKSYAEVGSSQEIGKGVFKYSGLNVYDNLKQPDRLGASLVIDYDIPNGQIIYSGLLSQENTETWEYRDDMSFSINYHRLDLNRSKFKKLIMNNTVRYEQKISIVDIEASISNVLLDHKDDFRYYIRFSE